MADFLDGYLAAGTLVAGAFVELTATDYARVAVQFPALTGAGATGPKVAPYFGPSISYWGPVNAYAVFPTATGGPALLEWQAGYPSVIQVGQRLTPAPADVALSFPSLTNGTTWATGTVLGSTGALLLSVVAGAGGQYSSGTLFYSGVGIPGSASATVDVSAMTVVVSGGTTSQTLAKRFSEQLDLLDFGADPTGATDSTSAFSLAVSGGGTARRIVVPPGTYTMSGFVNEPTSSLVCIEFMDGANIVPVSGGGLGVDRVQATIGGFELDQTGGGYFGFPAPKGLSTNPAFRTDVVTNSVQNSSAMRVTWNHVYTNQLLYGKYYSGIEIAHQRIMNWPNVFDGSSGWGHWDVILGPTYDDDSRSRANVVASVEHSEYDVSNNGPEAGWTYKSGYGNTGQGISVDSWGQNGSYGGHLLYAYGSVGSYDGGGGTVNQRWVSYPSLQSSANPAVLASGTLSITMDLRAQGSASLSAGGVSSVAISNGGGLYSGNFSVQFTGGGGSGAAGTANVYNGFVTSVTMTAAGTGYTSAPSVTFTGGGVSAPTTANFTLNPAGVNASAAAAAAIINAANITGLYASTYTYGGAATYLVIAGTTAGDLGTLTVSGTALPSLGITAGSYVTQRNPTTIVFGNSTAQFSTISINGVQVTFASGASTNAPNAINAAAIPGVSADRTYKGNLVITSTSKAGLVLANVSGATLSSMGLNAGSFLPPTPPKAFATAYGELTSPVCATTNQLSISATNLAGTVFGPVTVTLNGGGATGSLADVVASILAAITAAGWYNSGNANLLSTSPAVLAAYVGGSSPYQGIVLKNTAGGTITLANVTGTPLATLGLTPGTYKPGGYGTGSQSVFMAAPDSVAPQGRVLFAGGASLAITDQTVWPHAPVEARGSFLHGLRTDKATFADNNAVLVGAGQAVAFGLSGPTVTAGTGAPATVQPNGSLYMRSDGGAGTRLYVSNGATWTAVSGV